jgi:hypothetical protein
LDYYVCPICKTENEDYVKYCKRCGTWLLNESFPARKVVKKRNSVGKILQRGLFIIIGVIALIGVIGQFLPGSEQFTVPTSGAQTASVGTSRANPAPFGMQVISQVEQLGEQFTVGVTVNKTLRGYEALQMIKGANMFNPDPVEGHEYILADITVKVIESKNQDVQLQIGGSIFTLVSSDGKDYAPVFMVSPEPRLDTNLYAGATHRGWAVFQVYIEDKNPLIVTARDDRGRGGLWFLSTETEVTP